MTSVSVWHFEAGVSVVKVIKTPVTLKTLYALLNCKTVDAQTIQTSLGIFTIWYNDNGIADETVFNKPASQVLGKLPIRWGTMNGNFVVTFSKPAKGDDDSDDDGEPERADMPIIGFKEWIDLCSKAISERWKAFKACCADCE
jgi:hypothetical protein